MLFSVSNGEESDYNKGKKCWKDGDYQEAYTFLLKHRKKNFGRTPEVDYMLGTSGCRLPERTEWGCDVLDWMLYAYPLLDESQQIVTHERDLCREAISSLVTSEISPGEIGGVISAGMSGRGKTFYWIDKEVPVNSYPIRHSQKIELEEFRVRRHPIGQRDKAVDQAKRLVTGFKVLGLQRFVLASKSQHSDEQLNQIAGLLEKFLTFLNRDFGINVPDYYFTVYLVPSVEDLRKLADKLHGLDVSPATIGYAFQEDLSVVGVIPGEKIGTLLHEFFHLAVRCNFGDIPQWLDEGMASLYEVSQLQGDKFLGVPNWRGKVLKELWELRPPLEELIGSNWFPYDLPDEYTDSTADKESVQKQAAYLAMARYFVLYLQNQGKLKDVFTAFRKRELSKSGIKASKFAVSLVKRVLVKKTPYVQNEFERWFEDIPRHGGSSR